MKDIFSWVAIIALLFFNIFTFLKLQATEERVSNLEGKSQYWDKAVEVLEDCLEYNTLGECKQKYPQYGD